MNIDVFPHVLPKPYFDKIQQAGTQGMLKAKGVGIAKALHDLDARIRDEFKSLGQGAAPRRVR